MARNMITGIETQKMQEYTQEQIDRAEPKTTTSHKKSLIFRSGFFING